MPSSSELNIGPVPSPRRRHDADDGDAPPFRVVVLGDFSGRPRAERGSLAERRTVRVDIDNFESVFARIAPLAEIAGLQDKLGVALRIKLETMEEFSADAVLARLPARPAQPLTVRQVVPLSLPDPAVTHGHPNREVSQWITRVRRAPGNTNGAPASAVYLPVGA